MQPEFTPQRTPDLSVTRWLNISAPMSLTDLRGKVVVIHAFQMLCPGCVAHGLPQARSIYELYDQTDVQVIGLHSVFEHHRAMNEEALEAFIHEYRIAFPIAIDKPSLSDPRPETMIQFQMQGTPTLIILDKTGNVRLNHFGRMHDMQVGSLIGGLVEENRYTNGTSAEPSIKEKSSDGGCDDDGCLI
jgi:peroxiredoxin